MTRLFLTAAAAFAAMLIPAAPAIAGPDGLAASSAGVTIHRGPNFRGDIQPSNRRSGRFDRRHGFDGIGYLAVPEYQGDSLWRPTGFNDWWHERPERSQPRWLGTNNCERQYWSGSGWRC